MIEGALQIATRTMGASFTSVNSRALDAGAVAGHLRRTLSAQARPDFTPPDSVVGLLEVLSWRRSEPPARKVRLWLQPAESLYAVE